MPKDPVHPATPEAIALARDLLALPPAALAVTDPADGTPAISRIAPCQLFCSLVTLNTMTFVPFFNVTFPLSASSMSGRGSVNAQMSTPLK